MIISRPVTTGLGAAGGTQSDSGSVAPPRLIRPSPSSAELEQDLIHAVRRDDLEEIKAIVIGCWNSARGTNSLISSRTTSANFDRDGHAWRSIPSVRCSITKIAH